MKPTRRAMAISDIGRSFFAHFPLLLFPFLHIKLRGRINATVSENACTSVAVSEQGRFRSCWSLSNRHSNSGWDAPSTPPSYLRTSTGTLHLDTADDCSCALSTTIDFKMTWLYLARSAPRRNCRSARSTYPEDPTTHRPAMRASRSFVMELWTAWTGVMSPPRSLSATLTRLLFWSGQTRPVVSGEEDLSFMLGMDVRPVILIWCPMRCPVE